MQARESKPVTSGPPLEQVLATLLRTCLARLAHGGPDGAHSGSETEEAQTSDEGSHRLRASPFPEADETAEFTARTRQSTEGAEETRASPVSQSDRGVEPSSLSGFWKSLLREEPWPEELDDQNRTLLPTEHNQRRCLLLTEHESPSNVPGPSDEHGDPGRSDACGVPVCSGHHPWAGDSGHSEGAQLRGVPVYPLYKRLAAVLSLPEPPTGIDVPAGCSFDWAWGSCQSEEATGIAGRDPGGDHTVCSGGNRGSGGEYRACSFLEKSLGLRDTHTRPSPSPSTWRGAVSTVWVTVKQLQQVTPNPLFVAAEQS